MSRFCDVYAEAQPDPTDMRGGSVIGPEQSPEVMREAGRRAVYVRRIRAEVKRMIQDGETSLAEVLEASEVSRLAAAVSEALGVECSTADVSDALARMRVVDLLRALPGFGHARAERLMKVAHISSQRRIRGLGHRQQVEILKALDERN
jgi:hypothetical protein